MTCMPLPRTPHVIDVDWLLAHDWWSRFDRSDPDACWLWPQSCGSHGYGQTWDGSAVLLAHRVAWTLANGPIPPGMTVDHGGVCGVPICCNPAHLRLLTNEQNAANAFNVDTCRNGLHPWPASIIKNGKHQTCGECRRISNERRKAA